MAWKSYRLGVRLALVVCFAGFGTVAASAQTVTVLHSFGDGSVDDDGGSPVAAVVQGADGAFYGTTQGGGSAGQGAVFQMTPSGTVTTLVSFTGANGAQPLASLAQGADGDFYGTTWGGGSFANGTVFKITSAGMLTTLHDFSATSSTYPFDSGDGANPWARLVLGGDGGFYGTTQLGGVVSGATTMPNAGTVFKITPSGTLTTAHVFGNGSADGLNPYAALVLGANGDFYGTTQGGGPSGQGTVFQMTPDGTVTMLAAFTGANGAHPVSGLVQGPDGALYGTTEYGGASGTGTVFKVAPSGTVTTLHDFAAVAASGDNADGAWPQAALVFGSDGDLYGTAPQGGASGGGTLFKVTTAGVFADLHDFGDGTVANDGLNPQAALTPAGDGGFYGTTFSGGSEGGGTVFRLTMQNSGSAPASNAHGVAAASNGTSRLLWTRADGAAAIWSMSGLDLQTAVGPTYGPYAGWAAKAISVAGDESSRLLWTRSDGAAGLWTLDAQGTQTGVGPAYGPYPGWSAVDLAAASDGSSRVLWTNANGQAGVWTLGAGGTETLIGPTYGPFPGWTAKAVGVASDGTSRVLWTNTNGAMGLWTMKANDALQTVGTTYGPFAGWSALGMGTSADGRSQVLWTRTDGAAGLWTLDAAGVETSMGPVNGPFAGYTAMATDAADEQPRVLWVRSDRSAGLWSFGPNDAESVIGSVYGPF